MSNGYKYQSAVFLKGELYDTKNLMNNFENLHFKDPTAADHTFATSLFVLNAHF